MTRAQARFDAAYARLTAMYGEPGVFAAGLVLALRHVAARSPELAEVAAQELEAWVDALTNPNPLPKNRRSLTCIPGAWGTT